MRKYRADESLVAATRLGVAPEKVNWMVYRTALNSAEKQKDPHFDPWRHVSFRTPGAFSQVREAQKFILRPGELGQPVVTY